LVDLHGIGGCGRQLRAAMGHALRRGASSGRRVSDGGRPNFGMQVYSVN
jgi:hypothetical protein